jgi:hypothetical protein
MSTTDRGKGSRVALREHALGPRGVRLRNVLLGRLAIRLGLRTPDARELEQLDDSWGLDAAFRAWAGVQRGRRVDRGRHRPSWRQLAAGMLIALLAALALVFVSTSRCG